MPFCRKCGRRLREYSKSCPDCGTSTTAPIIKIKQASSTKTAIAAATNKVAEPVISAVPEPVKVPVQVKVAALSSPPPKPAPKPVLSAKHIRSTKTAKPKSTKPAPPEVLFPAKTTPPKSVIQAKPKRTLSRKIIATQSVPPPIPPPKPAPPPKAATPTIQLSETKTAFFVEPVLPPKPTIPVAPAPVLPPHEIIKSNVSLKEDFIAHPQDYETETFHFSLRCINDHYWRAGTELPVSNGKAICPQCGEMLRKPRKKGSRKPRQMPIF
ncbi:MAG: zinc ribbon domain-containing protein [Candidatus Bathyarchaeota archaeon]|nr:zinc ribbon domain-containing protein [Candidatus Bathyarchaeota archaeon]